MGAAIERRNDRFRAPFAVGLVGSAAVSGGIIYDRRNEPDDLSKNQVTIKVKCGSLRELGRILRMDWQAK